MKEQLPTLSSTDNLENRSEKTFDFEKEVRGDVHERIEKLGVELKEALSRYASGERKEREIDKIVGNIWNMYDICVLFSEYRHTQDVIDNLESVYPDDIGNAFKDSMQDNPVSNFRLYKSFFETPLERINKPRKEEYLGSKGRQTGRSAEEYMDLLDLKKEDIIGQQILDIGAGEGNFAKWAVKNGARKVVGIEPSQKADGDKERQDTTVEILSADWKNLPLPDYNFDRVVSVFAFPLWAHDWKEIGTALREIIRVTKKGGTIHLSPGAPVLEKGDVNASTFRKWKKEHLDIAHLLDCIHRKEYEEMLLKFTDQVNVTLGKPSADFGNTSQVEYYPLVLKKK